MGQLVSDWPQAYICKVGTTSYSQGPHATIWVRFPLVRWEKENIQIKYSKENLDFDGICLEITIMASASWMGKDQNDLVKNPRLPTLV